MLNNSQNTTNTTQPNVQWSSTVVLTTEQIAQETTFISKYYKSPVKDVDQYSLDEYNEPLGNEENQAADVPDHAHELTRPTPSSEKTLTENK